jgi:putative transposase
MQLYQSTESCRPRKFGGHKKPLLADHEETVRALIAVSASATLAGLQQQLDDRGIKVGLSSIDRFLKRLRLSLKKLFEPQRSNALKSQWRGCLAREPEEAQSA